MITRKVIPVPPFTKMVDTIDIEGLCSAASALKAMGYDGVYVYLGQTTSTHVDILISQRLGVIPVTFANRMDPAVALQEMHGGMQLPHGQTPALDSEGSGDTAVVRAVKINAWANGISVGGDIHALYVGEEQFPMTRDQLGALNVFRYWKSASDVPVPTFNGTPIGYCGTQFLPGNFSLKLPNGKSLLVDVDFIAQDFKGRVPTWTVAA